MRNLKSVLLCSSFLILGACGYAAESSHQDISFVTPGAEDARCYVDVNNVKYKVFPPQTVNIKKSDEEMIIKCSAPGNRERVMEVSPEMTKRAIWGTPAGMAWDYASQSLYYYPSVIAVDFSQEELIPNSLPKHNNKDIMQPEEYDLEEFSPSTPRLNSDKHDIKTPLLRKDDMYSDKSVDAMNGVDSETAAEQGGIGNLQDLIADLTAEPATDENAASSSPSSSSSSSSSSSEDLLATEASSEPVSLYPGQ